MPTANALRFAPMNFDMDDPRWTFNAAVNAALASGVRPEDLVGGSTNPIPIQGHGFNTQINPRELHPAISGMFSSGNNIALSPDDFRTQGNFVRSMAEDSRRQARTRAAAVAALAAGGAAFAGAGGGSAGAAGGTASGAAGGAASGAAGGAAGSGAAAAGGSAMANGFWSNIGGSLISGLIGTSAAGRAADAQTEANQAAIAEQRRQFDTILGLTQPGRDVGNQSLNAIASLVGLPGVEGMEGFDPEALMNMPGTDTIVNDAIRRIRQSGAARGSAGGNVLTELGDRISGFQSDRMTNALFQLAGFGPQATSTASGAAGAAGANIGNLLQSSGVANASGILGAGQSQNAALQNILQFQALNRGGGGMFNPAGPNGLRTINMNAVSGLRI